MFHVSNNKASNLKELLIINIHMYVHLLDSNTDDRMMCLLIKYDLKNFQFKELLLTKQRECGQDAEWVISWKFSELASA
jgi:hypothetical protein